MPTVYINGSPKNDRETKELFQKAFDEYMFKTPLEQRRFLRRFGFSETEIDQALQNPELLEWKIRSQEP